MQDFKNIVLGLFCLGISFLACAEAVSTVPFLDYSQVKTLDASFYSFNANTGGYSSQIDATQKGVVFYTANNTHYPTFVIKKFNPDTGITSDFITGETSDFIFDESINVGSGNTVGVTPDQQRVIAVMLNKPAFNTYELLVYVRHVDGGVTEKIPFVAETTEVIEFESAVVVGNGRVAIKYKYGNNPKQLDILDVDTANVIASFITANDSGVFVDFTSSVVYINKKGNTRYSKMDLDFNTIEELSEDIAGLPGSGNDGSPKIATSVDNKKYFIKKHSSGYGIVKQLIGDPGEIFLAGGTATNYSNQENGTLDIATMFLPKSPNIGFDGNIYFHNINHRFTNFKIRMVTDSNKPPTANAGPDQVANIESNVMLDGTESSDPENNVPLSFAWQITQKPVGSNAVLDDSTSATPSFTADVIGDYVIELAVTDSKGLPSVAADKVVITAADLMPPIVTVPLDQLIEATSAVGAVAIYPSVTATDNVGIESGPDCVPASGSMFEMGNTLVMCTATDAAGNTGLASFMVTVQDTTSPVFNVLSDILAEATSSAGAVVNYSLNATDNVGVIDGPTCSHQSGDVFDIGNTTVICSASDAAGNTGQVSFTINVTDTTAPVLSVPANIILEATSSVGTVVTYSNAIAEDAVGVVNGVNCLPASGSVFALGVTQVQCSASDAAGNTGSAFFTVTIQDTVAPSVVINAVTDDAGESILNGDTTTSNEINFDFSGEDTVGVVRYECSLNGSVFTVCSSPVSYVGLQNMTHTFVVRAFDMAGLYSEAMFSWNIEQATSLYGIEEVIVEIQGILDTNPDKKQRWALKHAIKKLNEALTALNFESPRYYLASIKASLALKKVEYAKRKGLDKTVANPIIHNLSGIAKVLKNEAKNGVKNKIKHKYSKIKSYLTNSLLKLKARNKHFKHNYKYSHSKTYMQKIRF